MRNFLLASLLVVCSLSAARAQESGFKEIFNGKDLAGWKGNEKLWSVEEGAITGRTTAEDPIEFNTFLVWQDGEVADFELQLEYRLQAGDPNKPGGNSGIQYRSKLIDEAKFIVGGYQADIDLSLQYSGINYEERGRGILAQRGQRVTIISKDDKKIESIGSAEELGKKIKGGEWNKYRIVAKGNKLSHYINDTLMSEVIDEQADAAAKKGVLAFQIHQGPPMIIQFRKVMLKSEK
jgi:hypothetical protein